jgi:uncharacterized membrane protein
MAILNNYFNKKKLSRNEQIQIIDIIKNINGQRKVSYFAFTFYPTLGYLTMSKTVALYSFVCSTFHQTYAYNLEKQLGHTLFHQNFDFDMYDGYKYRITPEKIIFEKPCCYNFYYSTWQKKYVHDENDYINLEYDVRNKIDDVMEYRRMRFRCMMSICCVCIMAQYVVGYKSAVVGFVVYVLFSYYQKSANELIIPKQEEFTIRNMNHNYFVIDRFGNVKFTNNKYGIRRRYLTKRL